MRVSIVEKDSGYHPRAVLCQVFLDGELLDDCFTADEELGEAHRYKKDKKGQLCLNRNRDEIVRIVSKGAVRVVVPLDF